MGVKGWGSAKNMILKEIAAVGYMEVFRERSMWNGRIGLKARPVSAK